jgi:autophagy-related protein 2
MKLAVTIPVVRIEVRTPPPLKYKPRSGAIVLDIHDLRVFPGDQSHLTQKATARFSDAEYHISGEAFPQHNPSQLLFANWQRLTFSYQPVNESKAQMILSLGLLSVDATSNIESDSLSVGSPPTRGVINQRARPQLMVSKTLLKQVTSSELTKTVLAVDIPSVHLHLGKREIDGLQLWADDFTQLVERAMKPTANAPETDNQSDPSLIGSRFFNKTKRSQGSETDSTASTVMAPTANASSETNVKITVSEGR